MTEYVIKQNQFKTKYLGNHLYHFHSITSTQTFLKKLVAQNIATPGYVVLADHQRMGRGTQGREWFALPKPQLTFSVLIQPSIPIKNFPILNILCSSLLVQIFRSFNIEAQIKWPNDVLIGGKKISGILSELVMIQSKPCLIVGVGVNIEANLDDFPPELQNKATALSMHRQDIDRMEILELFLQELEILIDEWSTDQLLLYTQACFNETWRSKYQKIEIKKEEKIIQGTIHGINSMGALEIQTENGLETIHSRSMIVDSTY